MDPAVHKVGGMTKNSGRSTTGGPKVPYHPRSRLVEAAKHLRLTTSRFIDERALFSEVEEAMSMLRSAAQAGERPAAPSSPGLNAAIARIEERLDKIERRIDWSKREVWSD